MAHSVSARKRVRQNEKDRARNRWRLKSMRDAIKEFELKSATGTPEELKAAFLKAQKVIDRSAQHGTIHRNQASRRKSRLNARLVAASTPGATKAAAAKSAPKAAKPAKTKGE